MMRSRYVNRNKFYGEDPWQILQYILSNRDIALDPEEIYFIQMQQKTLPHKKPWTDNKFYFKVQ